MTQRYANGAGEAPTPNGHAHAGTGNGKRGRRNRAGGQAAPAPTPTVILSAPPPLPPAAVFQTGAVETCVWMNPTSNPAQPCVWTVTQARLYPAGAEVGRNRSLRYADLDAARWGLVLARRWIRKAERRGALRSLFGR